MPKLKKRSAGRPRMDKMQKSVYLDRTLIEALSFMKNASSFINEVLYQNETIKKILNRKK